VAGIQSGNDNILDVLRSIGQIKKQFGWQCDRLFTRIEKNLPDQIA
jgi:hypothetical protein